MREKSVTWRGLKLYHSFSPSYFPCKALETLLNTFSPYFNLWMSAEIVTALYQGSGRERLYRLVMITLLVNLVLRIGSAFLKKTADQAFETLENNQSAAFYKKTLSLDYDKLENPEIRRLRRKIVENGWINGYGASQMRWRVEELFSVALELLFSAGLVAEMVSLAARASLRWEGILLFLLMAASAALAVWIQAAGTKKLADYWKRVGDLMLWENRISDGTRVLGVDNRIYLQQELIRELDQKTMQEHRKCFIGASGAELRVEVQKSLFYHLARLWACLLICLYCILGSFPVGSVIKYVGYLGRTINSIGRLFSCVSNLKNNEPFLETWLSYFELKNDMYQGSLAVEKRSDWRFDISFRDVSFRYAGSGTDALKKINLDLHVGEKLAVVGQNGSGKTTFIKLLCRLYDPTEGEIRMNDFNIRKYDYRQYLDLFSVVFQDYNLLALPLGNNVASAAEWDRERAERLLEQVGFGERYAKMPKGLETPLYKEFDEDGVIVSGGEAQKIALARALYRDAPFIILDEPTAALDPIAESEIYSRFDEIVGKRTAIYISHRLSSCRFCDRIAVFDEGEIVQVGTHEELLADTGGKYYELWNAQAQYYR
ncbi:MAG: ABC transporter ATP-binding protein/permease [Roseburia sp.]|nr:ABC transporter ATP-binding protein/permease [Roseburia sp.]MCM1099505.1 ABC transporter ATP-binding protein/permease [Ruminococcus flavefaciens]